MRRVLILAPPEDRAGCAVNLAADLARRADLEVFLVRVLEEGLYPAGLADEDEGGRRLRDLLVEAETRALDRLAGPLRPGAKQLDTSVSWGVPWETVLERVGRLDIDLVVKPARGLSHEGRVFFGATALHLFRKCPCPVWVVGDEGRLPGRILAAIDPGNERARGTAGRLILAWSQHVAALTGAELHVASYWHAPAADLLKGEIPAEELDAYVGDAQARARQALGRVLASASHPIPSDRVHLMEGDARDQLPRFAESQGFDLIAMGTLGRTDVAGEILGETAEIVLRSVRSSVLTVSPRSPEPERAGGD